MAAQKKNTRSKTPPAAHFTDDLRRRTTRSHEILALAVQCAVKEMCNGNLREFVRQSKFPEEKYNQLYHVLSQAQLNTAAVPLPRVVNTFEESKLYQAVAAAWDDCVETEDFFLKFQLFFEKVQDHYGSKNNVTKVGVKKILKHMGVYVVQASNVANAEKPKSCKNRLERAQVLLQLIQDRKIGQPGGSNMYFYDECNINQLAIQDDECLSPFGVQPFREGHHTITTESLTLQLIVDDCSRVHHWKLIRNVTEGSTDFRKVIEFLEEFVEYMHWTTKDPPIPFYLDNAPIHVRALKTRLDDPYHKQYQMCLPWSPRQLQLQQQLECIWAPSCTPEGNLAEFFFRSFKAQLKKALGSLRTTLKGDAWLNFVKMKLEEWFSNPPLQDTILQHIVAYMKRLVTAKGNLKVEAILAAGFANVEEFKNKAANLTL